MTTITLAPTVPTKKLVRAYREGVFKPTAIEYPESDGEPVGETDYHIAVILYLRQALRHIFRQAERMYVAANMLLYYEEGDPSIFKVPDVFVVKGVARHDRRVYKLWEEKVTPCAIWEITSRGTRTEDMGDKRGLYEMLGVREYFLFDPLEEYLTPRLQGFRLQARQYRPLELSPEGALYSRELGIVMQPREQSLLVLDPASGKPVPTLDEAIELAQLEMQRAQTESQRAQTETQRADKAEAELAGLRAELARLQSQAGQT